VNERQTRTWINIVVGLGALAIMGLIVWVVVQMLIVGG
jgi:hypothetical protein